MTSLHWVISNGFAKFFSTAAQKLRESICPLITNTVWGCSTIDKYSKFNRFKFKQVSIAEVKKHLKKIKRKKATGPDNLPAGFLKDIGDAIAEPFTHLINMSLLTGIVPNDFKIGNVKPLFKSGNVLSLDNYRPITILPILSKILEKCVHAQLMAYLESNELLSKF